MPNIVSALVNATTVAKCHLRARGVYTSAMAKSIKLSDEVVNIVRCAAEIHGRSVGGQAEYWLRLGRAIERAPGFDYQRVNDALANRFDVDALSFEEQQAYFDRFDALMENPSPEARAFFAALRARGGAVGELDDGTLVRQLPGGKLEPI